MAKSKLVKVNEKIAENVVGGYKKIEETVVGGYKKIEDGVVGGFNRMSDHFVNQFLTKEGETVEQAKQRLAKNSRSVSINKKRKSCFRPGRIMRSGLCLLQKGAGANKTLTSL